MRFFFIVFLVFLHSLFAERPVVLIVGTRPEAIKMIPLYLALQKENVPAILCSTGQHAELLDHAFSIFGITPDINFKIMKPNQDLYYITQAVLEKTKQLYQDLLPAMVVVQGDTTSAMAAALSAFYQHIPIAHVEAGLRTHNLQAPFPEELNRRLISQIATYHFAPTQLAATHLKREGINEAHIFCTGNTVVDSLQQIQEKLHSGAIAIPKNLQHLIELHRQQGDRIILLTAHRQESFKQGLAHIFSAMKTALVRYPNLFIILTQHPNPTVLKIVEDSKIAAMPNIAILPPLLYSDMVYLLSQIDLVATDSGGLQEEAISLGKPVLILRNETDRPEGLVQKGVSLVGTDPKLVLEKIDAFMQAPLSIASPQLIYGDGHASEKIALTIKKIITDGPL